MIGLLLALQEFTYTEWDAWKEFAVGASVVMEMEVRKATTRTTTVLKKKEDTKLTVEVTSEFMGYKQPTTERFIEKPEKEADKAVCVACEKPAHVKTEKRSERIKVKAAELDCTVFETRVANCEGQEIAVSTIWYAKEIPGGMAKLETDSFGQKTKMICVDYHAKK